MSFILYHTFELLSRLCSSVRFWCSLRRLVYLLPAGPPAPRLELCIPPLDAPYDFSDSVPTDETYTTTTSLTDFEEEYMNRPFAVAHTSTPNRTNTTCYRPRSTFHRCRSDHTAFDTGGSVYYAQVDTDDVSSDVLPLYHVEPRCRKNSRFPSTRSKYPRIPARKRVTHGIRVTQSTYRFSGRSQPDDEHNDRITHLETELARLRSQLAELVLMQEGKHLLSTPSTDGRLDGDGESDAIGTCETGSLSYPSIKTRADDVSERICPIQRLPTAPCDIPLPPIPPPPPPPTHTPKPVIDWRAQLIAAKQKKNGTESKQTTRSATPGGGDMSQVLKELQSGSIKLRPVPRSPGGTPIREQQPPPCKGTDPCSIIARAMQSKFSQLRAALDMSGSGGENMPNDSTQGSGLDAKDTVTHQTKQAIFSNENCAADTPPYGQHILRPIPKEESNSVR